MRTRLTLEHALECGCILRSSVVTTYDGAFDLAGKALKQWLTKELARHKCPKTSVAGDLAPRATSAGNAASTGATGT